MIVWLGLLGLLGNAARLAFVTGLLDAAGAEGADRLRGVLAGAGILAFGNYLPKLLSPWLASEEPFDWQGVHRFVGRLFVLGGVATIGFWIALPIPSARTATVATMLTVALLAIVRKVASIVSHARPTASPGDPR